MMKCSITWFCYGVLTGTSNGSDDLPGLPNCQGIFDFRFEV